ncbi:MAG: hypothetical protein NTW19_03495 [Planctomycetota bacterium]|nr:hypothetical protein [Planctomycetota bacterium]
MTERSTRPRRTPASTAALLLLGALLAINIHRAVTQSITYDEAFTYLQFASGPWDRIFDAYDANHHVLHTILVKLSTSAFGVSEWSVRLPSLCGGAVYLVAALLLCRRLLGTGWAMFVLFAALGLNPIVLDFLSAARGYGLALGFFTAALLMMTRSILEPGAGFKGRWLSASIAMGLSVCANLTLVIPCTAAAAIFAVLVLADPRALPPRANSSGGAARRLGWLAGLFILPGPLLAADLLWAPLRHANREHFYVGTTSWLAATRDLVDASIRHNRWADAPPLAALAWLAACVIVPGVILLALVALVRLWAGPIRRGGLALLAPRDLAFHFLGGTFLLTLAILFIAHHVAGLLYPIDRTGLYLPTLFCLTVALLPMPFMSERLHVEGAAAPPRNTPRTSLLLASAAVLFVLQFNTTHYRVWRHEADLRSFIHAALAHSPGAAPIRLGVDRWGPPCEFYAQILRGSRLRLVTAEDRPPTQSPSTQSPPDYLALDGAKRPEGYVMLQQDPASGRRLWGLTPTVGRP